MRLSVECVFSYLGKRGAALRKSTLCIHRLTEKHILYSSSYGKAHSSPGGVTKNPILDELCEKHDLHMRVHRYADLEKAEGDKSFIRR